MCVCLGVDVGGYIITPDWETDLQYTNTIYRIRFLFYCGNSFSGDQGAFSGKRTSIINNTTLGTCVYSSIFFTGSR
jgi:hypothetical protein